MYVYQNSKDKCHLQQECCRKNCYNLTKMSFWCFYWYLRILCTLVSKCLKQYLFTFFIFKQTCCFGFTDHHSLTSLSCKKRNNELKILWNQQSSCLCPRHRRFNVSVEIPFCSLLQLLLSTLTLTLQLVCFCFELLMRDGDATNTCLQSWWALCMMKIWFGGGLWSSLIQEHKIDSRY